MPNFVVDKTENDAWLEAGSPRFTFKNRPWAKQFRTEQQAITWANNQPSPDQFEIETSDGPVLGIEDGRWTVVFT